MKGIWTVPLVLLLAAWPAVASAQAHTTLVPLLVDLPGWQAGKAEGATLDMGGGKMVTVSREYTKGEARLTATVVAGFGAGATAAPYGTASLETDEVSVKAAVRDGFQTANGYDKREKSGSYSVIIATKGQAQAVFGISYEGVGPDEAAGLAAKFDWKAMQAAVGRAL